MPDDVLTAMQKFFGALNSGFAVMTAVILTAVWISTRIATLEVKVDTLINDNMTFKSEQKEQDVRIQGLERSTDRCCPQTRILPPNS